jgi:hypothetical protein
VVNIGLDEPPLEMQQAFDDSVQEPEEHPLGWQLVHGALLLKGLGLSSRKPADGPGFQVE